MTVVLALVLALVVKTFLVQAFSIPSASMENTLHVGDRVLVNKLVDKPDEIHRGDVIVFHDPGGWLPPNKGRGGVLGALHDALVFVGVAPSPSERDLIKRVIAVEGDLVSCCDNDDHVVVNGVPLTEDYVFPGDKPSEPEFSLVVPVGKLWVMGDHRSDSSDSRAHIQQPDRGFVPVENVIGRAVAIAWPVSHASLLHRPAAFEQPRLAGRGG